MTKLQDLKLQYVHGFDQCMPSEFTCLTASSVLRRLSWEGCRARQSLWQHVFANNLRLPHLTELDTASATFWQTPEIDQMASSCSALKQLSLNCSPGLQLTALLQLTGLSQLWLQGDVTSSTMTSLAQMSALQGLQTLVITSYSSFEDYMVVGLVKLTQLMCLALPYKDRFSPTMQQRLQRITTVAALRFLAQAIPSEVRLLLAPRLMSGCSSCHAWHQPSRLRPQPSTSKWSMESMESQQNASSSRSSTWLRK